MRILSADKLSKTVFKLRNKMNLTQAELGKLTGLHRIMIGRIEREDFTPSIIQLQSLAEVLGFDITDMFVEKEQSQSFIALRGESMTKVEREGVDALLGMMFALRQQILLRRKFEHESENHA
jgi:DNA-binding XRE family transcriptional regulator